MRRPSWTVPRSEGRRPAGTREESGNGLVFIIAVLPVVISSFGLGLDISRNVYIRTQIQSGVDNAVVAGAATTTTSAGVVVIDAGRAIAATEYYYAVNRPGTLKCTGPGTTLSPPYGAGANSTSTGGFAAGQYSRVCWTGGTPVVAAGSQAISWQIREVSPNSGFLSLVHLTNQTYNVKSKAVLKK